MPPERVVARRLSRLQKGLGEDYLQHREKYTTSLEQLYAGNSQVAAAPSIYAVYLPDGTEELPRFTKNRRKVVEAAQAGIRAVIELLGAVPDVNLHSVLLPITIGGESVRVKDQ